MIRTLLLALVLLGLPSLQAADDALAAFRDAMQGNDSTEKKRTIRALASGGDDQIVIPALIAAVGDRQIGDMAVQVLRSRTGLRPAPGEGENSGYPGYPRTDTAGGWTEWWNAKVTAQKTQQKLEKLEEQVAEVEEEPKPEEDATGAGEEEQPKGPDPTRYGDLGKLDRIFFTDGSSKLVYIIVKRVDLDDNLTSLRVVHRDGAGEEVLKADVIVRIEEDVK